MAVFTGSEYKGKSQKERIKEITDQLETGIVAVFESDAYKAYLNCMSKFHNYSLFSYFFCFQFFIIYFCFISF